MVPSCRSVTPPWEGGHRPEDPLTRFQRDCGHKDRWGRHLLDLDAAGDVEERAVQEGDEAALCHPPKPRKSGSHWLDIKKGGFPDKPKWLFFDTFKNP